MKTPSLELVGRSYATLIKVASWLQSPVLLIIRLYWGWSFVQTGRAKLMDPSGFADHFREWHIPAPYLNVLLAGTAETVGGALILIGLASRLSAIPLFFTMIVAYATAERDKLAVIFSDPDKFLGADPFLFLYAAVLILVFGPGVFSVDWILGKIFSKRASTPPKA